MVEVYLDFNKIQKQIVHLVYCEPKLGFPTNIFFLAKYFFEVKVFGI